MKLIRKQNDQKKYFIICPLCETLCDLGFDETLTTLPLNKELQLISDKKRQIRSELDEKEHSERLLRLQSTKQITVPRNIKLLQEYDHSIGKAGKTLIPKEHTGYIDYGLQESSDAQMAHWRAIIIGPQGVCFFISSKKTSEQSHCMNLKFEGMYD